jgi:hypothetical protein
VALIEEIVCLLSSKINALQLILNRLSGRGLQRAGTLPQVFLMFSYVKKRIGCRGQAICTELLI